MIARAGIPAGRPRSPWRPIACRPDRRWSAAGDRHRGPDPTPCGSTGPHPAGSPRHTSGCSHDRRRGECPRPPARGPPPGAGRPACLRQRRGATMQSSPVSVTGRGFGDRASASCSRIDGGLACAEIPPCPRGVCSSRAIFRRGNSSEPARPRVLPAPGGVRSEEVAHTTSPSRVRPLTFPIWRCRRIGRSATPDSGFRSNVEVFR
jgi:hypothetical protein